MNTLFNPFYFKFSILIISLISVFSISGGGDDESYWTNYNSSFAPEAFVDTASTKPCIILAICFMEMILICKVIRIDLLIIKFQNGNPI